MSLTWFDATCSLLNFFIDLGDLFIPCLSVFKQDIHFLWDPIQDQVVQHFSGENATGSSPPTAYGTVAFSDDGQLLAGSRRGGGDVWDRETGECRVILPEQDKTQYPQIALAFSRDRKMVFAGGNVSRLFSLPDGEEIWSQPTSVAGQMGMVYSAVFAPQHGYLIIAGGNWSNQGFIRVWKYRDSIELVEEFSIPMHVSGVVLSADERYLAAGDFDGGIHVFDVETLAHVRDLAGHDVWATSLSFAPIGPTLVSGSREGQLAFWNASSGLKLGSIALGDSASQGVSFIGFVNDGAHRLGMVVFTKNGDQPLMPKVYWLSKDF